MGGEPVVVVGAGIGGLAAAIRLAARGLDVTVLERAATVGGKMREVSAGGPRIDSGPTVLTLRDVFDDLFELAGRRLDDHLRLAPLGILARHAWPDGSRLDLHADPERSAAEVATFAGAAEADRFRDFCRRTADLHRALDGPFMRRSRPSLLGMPARLGLAGNLSLARNGLFDTMWRELGRRFRDPRLRQLFGRYATYCGSSPFAAPAILTLVAHVEQAGVWAVEGGMHRLAQALADLAAACGARIRTGVEVARVETRGGRASAVRLADGEALAASAVLFAGDPGALAAGLLGDAARPAARRVPAGRRSLSAVTWSLAAETSGFPLVRHGVFFSSDYRAEFEAIREGRIPQAPTVYVCAQDRDDRGLAAPGPERLLVLVNAPALGDARGFPPSEIDPCTERTFAHLARLGLTIHRRPDATVTTTPTDFDRLFPGSGGALYGEANHGWTASFRRPASRTAIRGLYLAGGATHPGPGVPMAALSGRLAAEAILADRPAATPVRTASTSTSSASIAPSSRAAMSGGTSMRSPTTAGTD